MGQEILYCYKCQTRLLGSDFEKRKAFKVGMQASCAECAKDLIGFVPEAKSDPSRPHSSTSRIPAVGPGPDSSSKHKPIQSRASMPAVPPPPAAPSSSKAPLVIAGAVVGLGAIVLIAMAMGGSRSPSRVDPPTPPPIDGTHATPGAKPSDPLPPPPPPSSPTFAGELREIDEKMRTSLPKGEFRQMSEFLQDARARRTDREWLAEIDLRIPQIEARARRAASSYRDQAVEAQRRQDGAEVQRLRAIIAAWKIPAILEEFEKALVDATAPPPPPPTPNSPETPADWKGTPWVVYDDALASGHLDHSWSGKVDYAATHPVFEGSHSIAFTPKTSGAGLYLGINLGVDADQYPYVTFALFLPEERTWMGVALYTEGKPAAAVGLDQLGGYPSPGQWKRYVVPVTRLNAVPHKKITGVILQVYKVGPQPLLYVDSVKFLKGAEPSPGIKPSGPPSVEVDDYRKKWAQAVSKAASRDYAAAQREIEEGAAGAKDEASKVEAAVDLELFKLAAPVAAEAARAIEKWTKGQKVRLEYVNGTGVRETIDGTVIAADAVRLSILRDAGPIELPVSELTAASLAEVFRTRSDRKPADSRAAAVFCLLEGDAEAGRRLSADGPALPEKYLAAAKARPMPDGEADARRVFWAAEADFATPKRRGAAVEKYSALLASDAPAFIARIRPFVTARLDGARDTVFLADDLGVSGTFILTGGAKMESFAFSSAETTGAKSKENFVEADFYAFAGAPYRAWVWAGGCCQETFDASYQASELAVLNPKKSGETIPIEPGTDSAATLKLPSITLKRWHAQHGGPKEPVRWEWIPIALPKYDAAGMKKLRILSSQQGFSVAAIVISATRKETPRDPEIKDLEKIRVGGRRALAMDPTGFVLHEYWSNITGILVEDLTKNPAFLGKPTGSGLRDSLEGPREFADNYGSRMRGYVHPPVSGAYTFWLATDDGGELWLSSDDTPVKKRLIAHQTMASGPREWTKYATQKSTPIPLTAGRRYYIEVLQKEGGGGDHAAAGWTLPDGTEERPIPGKRLSHWGSTPPVAGPPGTTFFRGYNINGSPTIIDGHKWEGKGSPNLAASADAFENQSVPLNPPVEEAKAAMIRTSAFARGSTVVKVYQMPAGTYQVFLYVWEDNDAQVFDIFLQGKEVVKGYNSGPGGHWDKLGPWTATVSDGVLQVHTSGGDANLSGLEIWKVGK